MIHSSRPLRGRDDVVAVVLGAVRRTIKGRSSSVVWVSGDPGMGKTALLSHISSRATHMNMRVAQGRCDTRERAVPAAVILSLLQAGADPTDPVAAVEELEELTNLSRNAPVFVDRTVECLRRATDARPLLVAIDDVQEMDSLSRYAFRRLIHGLAAWPVAWVFTSGSRDAELSVGGADVVDVEHVLLGALPRDAVGHIAQDRLDRPISDRERQLLDAAGGNPFLVVHIVTGLTRSRNRDSDGVPPEFHAATRYLHSRLSGVSRILTDALAVAGRDLHVAELCRICGVTAGDGYLDAVRAMVASSLVAVTGDEVRFVHDLVRQSVYESIPAEERRRLHARLAEHFLASSLDGALAGKHAAAAITVGDVLNADILVASAEALVATNAAAGADLASRAFDMLRPGQRRWAELGERALKVLSNSQRVSEAVTVAKRLLATIDDVDMVGRIQTHAVEALWHSGSYAEIVEHASHTIGLAHERPQLVARFAAARALGHARIAGADRAVGLADDALTQARISGDPYALAFALRAAGHAAHAQRRHGLALKYLRGVRTVTGVSYRADEIMQLQLLDRLDDAQTLLDAARADSRPAAEAMAPDVLLAHARQLYYLADDLDEADRAAKSVVELGRLIGTRTHAVEAAFMRVFVAMLRGGMAVASHRLSSVSKVAGDVDEQTRAGLLFFQGWLSNANGHTERGLSAWSQLLAFPADSQGHRASWPCWMPIVFEGGRACGATDVMEGAVACAEEAAARNPEVATLSGLGLSLRGLLDGDLPMVAASVEVLQRSPRRAIRAWGVENLGLMLVHRGDLRAGLARLDSAWDEWNHMGAFGRRASVQREMRRAGVRRAKWSGENLVPANRTLTEAEHRVAYLIADGHSDKSAARLLGVSVNTVGTHTRSAYSKLGVQSRVQMIKALRDSGELD